MVDVSPYRRRIPLPFERMWRKMNDEERFSVVKKVLKKELPSGVGASSFRYVSWKDIESSLSMEPHKEALYNSMSDLAADIFSDEKNIERLHIIDNLVQTQSPRYGLHTELAEVPSCTIVWSNAARFWIIGYPDIEKGEEIKLDADEILIPFKVDEIRHLLPFISEHWAYALSVESMEEQLEFQKEIIKEWANRWKEWKKAEKGV